MSRGAQVESDTMNINESFLKQANILKKILSKYLQEGDNADLEIRLEICDILNQYLDQKMDFCLNVFKMKFKEYIQKLALIEKLESGELNLEQDRRIICKQSPPPIVRRAIQEDHAELHDRLDPADNENGHSDRREGPQVGGFVRHVRAGESGVSRQNGGRGDLA